MINEHKRPTVEISQSDGAQVVYINHLHISAAPGGGYSVKYKMSFQQWVKSLVGGPKKADFEDWARKNLIGEQK